MKRKHQIETENTKDGIIAGSLINKILCKVTPGGGKSMLPIIAGKLIKAGLADALCWVVPRQTLQDQGERNFLDPAFRDMFDHNMVIRASTNDENPCRGLSGFITTYQAIGVCRNCLDFVFKRNRMILILDEFHHVELEGTWHKALKQLVKDAAYILLMTGTLERGDKKKISYIEYDEIGSGYIPKFEDNDKTKVIEYSRADALSEKAIIPLSFHLSDGQARWINLDGIEMESSIKKASKDIAPQALFTALSTGFADELLQAGLQHWQEIKKYNKKSKLLVVTSNYKLAKITANSLAMLGLNSEIATSHESKQAAQAIKEFRGDKIDILVTIAMAYEGLDVPDITHIVCLTNIRSTPWIEQMVARAVRIQGDIPYESQAGYIFAPDDVFFREIVKKIKKEQLPFVPKVFELENQLSLFQKKNPFNAPKIQPLSSNLNGYREVFVGNGNSIQPLTPSEIETALRLKIEKHVRKYSYNNDFKFGSVNREIKKKFGKGRAQMDIPDLEKVYQWIQSAYPINYFQTTL